MSSILLPTHCLAQRLESLRNLQTKIINIHAVTNTYNSEDLTSSFRLIRISDKLQELNKNRNDDNNKNFTKSIEIKKGITVVDQKSKPISDEKRVAFQDNVTTEQSVGEVKWTARKPYGAEDPSNIRPTGEQDDGKHVAPSKYRRPNQNKDVPFRATQSGVTNHQTQSPFNPLQPQSGFKVPPTPPSGKYEARSPGGKYAAGSLSGKFVAGSPGGKYAVGSPSGKYVAGSPDSEDSGFDDVKSPQSDGGGVYYNEYEENNNKDSKYSKISILASVVPSGALSQEQEDLTTPETEYTNVVEELKTLISEMNYEQRLAHSINLIQSSGGNSNEDFDKVLQVIQETVSLINDDMKMSENATDSDTNDIGPIESFGADPVILDKIPATVAPIAVTSSDTISAPSFAFSENFFLCERIQPDVPLIQMRPKNNSKQLQSKMIPYHGLNRMQLNHDMNCIEPSIQPNHRSIGRHIEPNIKTSHGSIGNRIEPTVQSNHGLIESRIEANIQSNHVSTASCIEFNIQPNHASIGNRTKSNILPNQGSLGNSMEPQSGMSPNQIQSPVIVKSIMKRQTKGSSATSIGSKSSTFEPQRIPIERTAASCKVLSMKGFSCVNHTSEGVAAVGQGAANYVYKPLV